MLTAGELALIRRDMGAMLGAECTVTRVTLASDGAGGTAETTSTVATVACSIAPLSGREAALAGAIDATVEHVIRLPAGTDVRATDRITSDGRTFEVTQPLIRTDEYTKRVGVVEGVN